MDTVKDCLKKREVWLSGKGKKGKECMIGVNGGGMSGDKLKGRRNVSWYGEGREARKIWLSIEE